MKNRIISAKGKLLVLFLMLGMAGTMHAEDGYDLWLRYKPLSSELVKKAYTNYFTGVSVLGISPTIKALTKELSSGVSGMLSVTPTITSTYTNQKVLIGTTDQLPATIKALIIEKLKGIGNEGFVLQQLSVDNRQLLLLTANSDIGLLYGTFGLLKQMQLEIMPATISVIDYPKTNYRLLNHWDNLDRTVERGYAGFSIWDWHKLPDYISPQYTDYARANASIGINGTVVTNVNSNALVLTKPYLIKLKALADVFRPYGIKVYLTARFSAPVEIGGLTTADPLNAEVQAWWNTKAEEIYRIIPDFGGFLVKANSEGQPGPQDYKRSHADGANMLAKAVAPHGGIVMWRAFVYSHEVPDDRANQAYNEFTPLDGAFEENVMVQVKNGTIDFQPREPFHPLFGAMEQTPLMMEFQITQEYLGCATNLVYLGSLFEEVLRSDTYAKGKGSQVFKVIDGSLHNYHLTGMAGVSNIGTDRNWTGHPFGQANWYAFGRLAWDPELKADTIADEWLRMTFTTQSEFINRVKPMMLNSRETAVNYMTPLGLHHQMAVNHHWGPGPWVDYLKRSDWNSVYYHKADENGIGFDRTSTGSNHVAQYFPEVKAQYENLETCPEELLLWFHHVPWTYKMKSGRTLWDELCEKYYLGVSQCEQMLSEWQQVKEYVDPQRFDHVNQLLTIQVKEAKWWRNAMLLYFQQYSKMPIPEKFDQPDQTLEHYKNQKFYYVPGI